MGSLASHSLSIHSGTYLAGSCWAWALRRKLVATRSVGPAAGGGRGGVFGFPFLKHPLGDVLGGVVLGVAPAAKAVRYEERGPVAAAGAGGSLAGGAGDGPYIVAVPVHARDPLGL